MTDSVICTESLGVSYGDTTVIEGIDFSCKKGEFVAIVGGSGSGKSTFLNALAGFIRFEGMVSISPNLGYLFQDFALFPWMTVKDNIGFGLLNCNLSQREEKVAELLSRIGMTEFSDRYPQQLSGGQAQRVAIARTFAPDPDVILMDEPYSSLDHYTRDNMQEWLLKLLQEAAVIGNAKTVLLVTHYLDEAIFLADRILVLKHGKFIDELLVPFDRPRVSDIRFSNEFAETKLALLQRILGNK